MTAAVTVGQAQSSHGRTKIAPRAVRRVVSAVTAEALGVDSKDVTVELADEGGSLTVVAKSPIHVNPLGEIGRREPGNLVDRLSAAQTTIRDRSLQLTGSTIRRVDLEITGAQLRPQKRRVS